MTCSINQKLNCKYCGEEFVQRRHNMIYCSTICCRQATNKKIIEKYHSNKLKKSSINTRSCSECNKRLSKYNCNDICYACEINKKEQEKINLLKTLGFQYIDEE